MASIEKDDQNQQQSSQDTPPANMQPNELPATKQTTQSIDAPAMQEEPVQEPKPVLVVCNRAKNLEIKYELEKGREIIVGADPLVSVSVEDEYLSFRHFSIKSDGSKVEVKDLGSKNGLYLKLEGTAGIVPGQTLLAGKTIFRLEGQKDEKDQPLP